METNSKIKIYYLHLGDNLPVYIGKAIDPKRRRNKHKITYGDSILLETNFVDKQIKDCCLGKQKTCYGYIWRYDDQKIVDTNFDYQNKLVYQFDNNKILLNSFSFNDLLNWLKTKYSNDNTSFVKRYKIFKACEQKILNKIMDSYWSFNNKI